MASTPHAQTVTTPSTDGRTPAARPDRPAAADDGLVHRLEESKPSGRPLATRASSDPEASLTS